MAAVERREVHLTIPIAPEMEMVATALVAPMAELMDLGRDKIDEVKMAFVEACINAFEHSDTPDRRVEIDFVTDERNGQPYFEVGVTDSGRGFDPAKIPAPDLATKLHASRKRGWGIKIIESLMDDVKIESNGHGTRIVMRKYR